jgi:hypothetical protein
MFLRSFVQDIPLIGGSATAQLLIMVTIIGLSLIPVLDLVIRGW